MTEYAGDYHLNTAGSVAVSNTASWIPVDKDTPRSVKLQLLTKGGVAIYSNYTGETFFTHWCPLPKRREDGS